MTPLYSVVIPIFNEEETIRELYGRLKKSLSKIQEPHEILFVNDGSADRSLPVMKDLASKDPCVKILDLSRNFGLQVAYSAGIAHASGDAVILMDGDLQDPPELIPDLVSKWKEGYDVVYTVKTKRKENIFKRFAFASFYRILKSVSSVDMPLDAGSFSVMGRRVVEVFNSLPERNRLVSGIRAWVGFKQTGISFERDARFHGEPRQTLFKLMRMATDGLFSFSAVPIRIATYLGLAVSCMALLGILLTIILRMFLSELIPIGWTSLIIAVMFFGGIQLLFVGVLGEYICRIFDEVKARPMYVIKEKIGFDRDER